MIKGGKENNSEIKKTNTLKLPDNLQNIDELHNDLLITDIIKRKKDICKNYNIDQE